MWSLISGYISGELSNSRIKLFAIVGDSEVRHWLVGVLCKIVVCLCTLHWACQKQKRAARKLHPIQHSSRLTSNMRRLQGEVIISNMNLFKGWGEQRGGAGWTRWDTALHLTMTLSPLIKTVSQLDKAGNGESSASASARVWWRNSLQRLTLLYPGTSLQGSCCHGHWMKVCKARWCGSAVPSDWTLSGVFSFKYIMHVIYFLYILLC